MGLMNSKMAIVRTARSCAYACSFCRYPVLAGRHVWSGVESVERELDSLKSTGATTLLFVDFRWMSYLRCGDADAEAIDLAADSGCLGVFIGIESGDEDILQKMNKKTTLKQYRTGIRQLRERGVFTHASVIFGFPGETDKTARATMRFLQDSGVDSFNSEAYYHDKKSPIGLKQDSFGLKGSGYCWSHDSMDWKRAAELVAESYRNLDGPVVIPLFRFSIWSIGYCMSEGIPQASMMDFLRRVHPFVIKSTDESYQIPTGSREALLSVFRDLDLGSGRLCE
jgi:p-methyltransferase